MVESAGQLKNAGPSSDQEDDVPIACDYGFDFGSDDSIRDPDYIQDVEVTQNTECSTEATPATAAVARIPPRAKRPRNRRKGQERWNKTIRKRKRNSGQQYISSKGMVRTEKTLKPGCGPTCRLKCHEKFSQEVRQEIFKGYWSLGEYLTQRMYIASRVKQEKKKSTRKVDGAASRSEYTNKYTLKFEENEHTICKKFFLDTLDISEKTVRIVLSKTTDTGLIKPDMRGRKFPPNKTPAHSMDLVEKHINSFPRVPSHWCRRDTKKEYLESILNGERMYDLYIQYCKGLNESPVCKTTYKEMVLKMNIGFHSPRKDQCWCYGYDDLPHEEKHKMEEKYLLHTIKKEAAQKMRENDTRRAQDDRTFLCGYFDLEAVLYSPIFFAKPLFYKRKLACYNSTFYNVRNRTGHCFMWTEIDGNRGSNEIGTCLINFLNEYIPPSVNHISLFCDSCPGQNKNSIMACAILCAIRTHDTLQICDLKFLEPGHTHMECDSMHATIERASEYAKIFIPSDWYNVVRLAKRTGTPYSVKILNKENFIDLKKHKTLNLTLNLADGNSKIEWKEVTWLRVLNEDPNAIYFKYDYDETTDFKRIDASRKKSTNVRRNKTKHHNEIPTDYTSSYYSAYNSNLPIQSAKYTDLLELCNTNVIPLKYHEYYKNLPHKETKKPAKKNNRKKKTNTDSSSEDDLPLAAMRAKMTKRKCRK